MDNMEKNNIDISNLTIEELVSLREDINNRILDYEDGFIYICNVRSYGRNWKESPKNAANLQELCYQYYGDDGIVDIYTTNPNLEIDNYGGTYFIESEEDYTKWKTYTNKGSYIKGEEVDWERLDEWISSNGDAVRSWNGYRPSEPLTSKEELQLMKEEHSNTIIDFIEPKSFNNYSNDDDDVE